MPKTQALGGTVYWFVSKGRFRLRVNNADWRQSAKSGWSVLARLPPASRGIPRVQLTCSSLKTTKFGRRPCNSVPYGMTHMTGQRRRGLFGKLNLGDGFGAA